MNARVPSQLDDPEALDTGAIDTASDPAAPISAERIGEAVGEAAARMAPYWPLQHFVAVNPLLGLAGTGLVEAGRIAARAFGARLTLPRSHYRTELARGRISRLDIAEAIEALREDLPLHMDVERCVLAARSAEFDPARLRVPTVADVASQLDGKDWSGLMVDRLSAWLAQRFDRGLAPWAAPNGGDLYRAWRADATMDLTADVSGLRGFRSAAAALPEDAPGVLEELVRRARIPADGIVDYFHRLLADLPGWAGYLRQRGWTMELRGEAGSAAAELLALRGAMDLVLLALFEDERMRPHHARESFEAAWRRARGRYAEDDILRWRWHRAIDHVLHLAAERARQRRLQLRFPGAATPASERPEVQAAFCIDVRSERLRRALEAEHPRLATIGFAGFFGVAAGLVGPAGEALGDRCPVLLEPAFRLADGRTEAHFTGGIGRAIARLRQAAAGCFPYVEAAGLLHGVRLAADTFGWRSTRRWCGEPSLDAHGHGQGLPTADRVQMAEGILRGMSLTRGFARIVLLAGHGARTVNNPYASGLDCGACGGHAGDLNARVAAQLLRDPQVRAGLAERGIEIPADTLFLAAVHDTTTDDVEILDAQLAAATHATELAALVQALERAGRRVRAERAPLLGLDPQSADRAIRRRTRDWSEVRPEWGLAGCADFIAAPRGTTSAMNLDGRAFLHDYDAAADAEGGVLELIMTAPLVVASWISLQYYGSTVDNRAFGSGDKTLHNVVAGLGVFEGNGGDLRPGLPWQSVHDGRRLMHEPVRLSAWIQTTPAAMNAVIERHAQLEALLDGGWIQLHALGADGRPSHRHVRGTEWVVLPGIGADPAEKSDAAANEEQAA